jgi:hypothetical protein
MEILLMRKANVLKTGIRSKDAPKKRRVIKILETETAASDLDYWLKKTPEQRLDAVELLREQFYAIQGYRRIPRIKRVVHKVEMDE